MVNKNIIAKLIISYCLLFSQGCAIYYIQNNSSKLQRVGEHKIKWQ